MVTERLALYNGYARQFAVRFTDFLSAYVSSVSLFMMADIT
jgi:hypothetical protein